MAKQKQPAVDLSLDIMERQLLADVVRTLRIPPCDLLLIGDGSGNWWNRACGWSCVLIEPQQNRRRLFYGAMNFGSIEFAELMPYMQALAWYDNQIASKEPVRRERSVVIVTDSEILVQHCTEMQAAGAHPSATLAIPLTVFRSFEQIGYRTTLMWYRRQELALNTLSDVIAGLARSQLAASEGWRDIATQADLSVRAARAVSDIAVTIDGADLCIYRVNPGGVGWDGILPPVPMSAT